MGKKTCHDCLGRDYIIQNDECRSLEILLSPAGRVPVLAYARLELYGTGCSAFLRDVLELGIINFDGGAHR